MAQTLSQIQQLLAAYGLHPKKRLGQNFLHDAHHMSRIVEAADIGPGDRVLEVGAGTGALSERLLEAGAELIASEIDADLEPLLRQRLAPWADRVTLVMGDVLAGKRQLAPAVATALGDEPFKLVANLPYNIASPLLVNLALDWPRMRGGVVMVQREVADRLTAAPGTPGSPGRPGRPGGPSSRGGRDYGPLGILIQATCQVKRLATLSPHCFWPSPQVESAVVQITRRARPLSDDLPALAALVQTLFQKRRKQIGSILGRDRITAAGLDPTRRPEQLALAELIDLAEHLKVSGHWG